MLITYIRTHLFMKDDLKTQEIFTTRFPCSLACNFPLSELQKLASNKTNSY